MPKLRVGLLMDDYVLASWAAEMVEMIQRSTHSEEIVTRVLPDWSPDLVSTHTFNRAGDLHVIDAQWRRRR